MNTGEINTCAENIISALNSALDCFDDDNDIECAVSLLYSMQEMFRILLPAEGIFAWSFDNMGERYVRAFSTREEAEAELRRDIETVRDEIEDGDLEDDTVTVNYDSGLLCATWKRFY